MQFQNLTNFLDQELTSWSLLTSQKTEPSKPKESMRGDQNNMRMGYISISVSMTYFLTCRIYSIQTLFEICNLQKVKKSSVISCSAPQQAMNKSNKWGSDDANHQTATWVLNWILNKNTRNFDSTRGTFMCSKKNWK